MWAGHDVPQHDLTETCISEHLFTAACSPPPACPSPSGAALHPAGSAARTARPPSEKVFPSFALKTYKEGTLSTSSLVQFQFAVLHLTSCNVPSSTSIAPS